MTILFEKFEIERERPTISEEKDIPGITVNRLSETESPFLKYNVLLIPGLSQLFITVVFTIAGNLSCALKINAGSTVRILLKTSSVEALIFNCADKNIFIFPGIINISFYLMSVILF